MGKYGTYKNRMEKFLASPNGKRFFNFAYSWGAAIVVLGALFKLTHLPYANLMLSVGMGIEVVMFFISAFDYPSKEYKWEEVFPVLDDKNGMNPSVGSGLAAPLSGVSISNTYGRDTSLSQQPIPLSESEAKAAVGIPPQIDLSEEDTRMLSASIQKLGAATEQLSRVAELSDSTRAYLGQLDELAANMKEFSEATSALTRVSNTLLGSYQSVSGEQGGVLDHSKGYVYQMESLNKNLSGLNTIYEIQLKSISSQINTIEQINAGLNRIREMYDNTSTDYCEESEKMTQLMAALNAVYYRMLDAMNMRSGGGVNQPPQPEM